MFFKEVKQFMDDLTMFCKFLRCVTGANSHIVHEVCKFIWKFLFDWAEILVGGSLEERWRIAESEAHDLGNDGSNLCFEGGFVVVVFVNEDVVIPGAYVKLCEDFFAFEFIKFSFSISHSVVVFDGEVIDFSIVNDHAEFSWLLFRD